MNKFSKRKKIMEVTRYAPSPTGFLHIGGARTALYNYLYAKKNNGKFILRIEDTDKDRNVQDGHIEIESSLKSLGIFPDESFSVPGDVGPYLQSQKLDRYTDLCNQLLNEGKAYRCFCTEEELEESRKRALENKETPKYSRKCRNLSEEEINKNIEEQKPFTVRLKVDIQSEYSWEDLIRGTITAPEDSMSDYIIMRSNGLPTYNFAVVIDDLDMEVSSVFRGEEHIANTPYQLATYHALGAQECIPEFGHLSIIVDENRKKLSKRSGDELNFVSSLISKGYVPDAIVNFLALLGWSHGNEEIFSMSELINLFDISGINKSPAFFDVEKLNWINKRYIQNMNTEHFWNYLIPIFTVDLGEYEDRRKIFALAHKNKIDFGGQLNDMAKEFYSPKSLNQDSIGILKNGKNLVELALQHFPKESEEWNELTIRNYLKQLSQISELKGKELYKPLRVAFSLEQEGFELFLVMDCLGRKTVHENLLTSLKAIDNE